MRACCTTLLVSILLVLVLHTRAEEPAYRLKSFDVPIEGAHETKAKGINDWGQIVGIYLDHQEVLRSFAYLPLVDRFVRVEPPDAPNVALDDINMWLQAVGSFREDGNAHACEASLRGVMPLDVPGAVQSGAQGINDRGEIVGSYFTGAESAAFWRSAHGEYLRLDFPNARMTDARGLNNRGQIVGAYDGIHGFLYEAWRWTTIAVPFPGAQVTVVNDINDQGLMVGSWFDGRIGRGFVSDGHTFTSLQMPGAFDTIFWGINNDGVIVGEWLDELYLAHGLIVTPLDHHGAVVDEP